MIKAALFCIDSELAADLLAALKRCPGVRLHRHFSQSPTEAEWTGYLRNSAPQVIFCDAASNDLFSAVLASVHRTLPDTAVIAIGKKARPEEVLKLIRQGAADFLLAPFPEIEESIGHVERKQHSGDPKPPGELIVFLPARVGDGCSTAAVHLARIYAQTHPGEALLVDLDLTGGSIGFQLKVNAAHSLNDILQHAETSDESVWSRVVQHRGPLHVLPAGPMEPGVAQLPPGLIAEILQIARSKYKKVFVDLSGHLEAFSLEALQQANRVFLVCSSRLISLHFAVEKVRWLERNGSLEHMQLLVTKSRSDAALTRAEIAKTVRLPVVEMLPEDSPHTEQAVTEGDIVPARGAFRDQIEKLAAVLFPVAQSQSGEGKRGLLSMLHLARET